MIHKKIILGSASPRRREIIKELGMLFEIRKKDVIETYPEELELDKVPAYLARLKASPIKKTIQEGEVLLTSDTIVLFEGEILHRPKNRKEAIAMLERMSNAMHEVITGVYLYSLTHEKLFSCRTKVFFKALHRQEIEYYVDKNNPYDKAGGYGIQEWIGMIGIHRIEGSFYNVMGLPIAEVWEALNNEF